MVLKNFYYLILSTTYELSDCFQIFTINLDKIALQNRNYLSKKAKPQFRRNTQIRNILSY